MDGLVVAAVRQIEIIRLTGTAGIDVSGRVNVVRVERANIPVRSRVGMASGNLVKAPVNSPVDGTIESNAVTGGHREGHRGRARGPGRPRRADDEKQHR